MSYKRVCDNCGHLFTKGDPVIIQLNGSYLIESCRACHDLQGEAYDKVKLSVEDRAPPLGYHMYVEDEFMFPSHLTGSESKLKIDFMYEKTNASNSRIQ